MDGVCPVTGKPCNDPIVWNLSERTGDKELSLSCCRQCASYFISARNQFASQQMPKAVMLSLSELVHSAMQCVPQAPGVKVCPGCNWTWQKINEEGRAGCEKCYETFPEFNSVLLQKHGLDACKGHVGKKPKPKDDLTRAEKELRILKHALENAVKEEDYTLAATIRDLIKQSESK